MDEEGEEARNPIPAFHHFISPFLLGRDYSNQDGYAEYSKWTEVVECFLAIQCLKEDGNFKQAKDVTQVFAKLEYACRGTTLYEALKNKAHFNNDPYR